MVLALSLQVTTMTFLVSAVTQPLAFMWLILTQRNQVVTSNYFRDGLGQHGNQKFKSYHTKDIFHILCMAQVKETKDFYQKHTKHVFEFMLKCASDGIQTEKGT